MTQSSAGLGERPDGAAEVKRAEVERGAMDRIARLAAWTRSNADAAVSLVLILVMTLCALIDHHPILVRRFFSVDACWALDLFFKAHQGLWAGRDVVFTYGPLYQWLLGVTSVFQGVSLGCFFRFGHLALFAYTVIVIFATARLLLRSQASWKRTLVIVGLTMSWTYFEVREATVLLLFALMLHLFDRSLPSDSLRLLPATLGSAAVISSFLLSGDSGIYGIVALIVVAGSYCICFRSDRTVLRRVLRFALLMCAGLLCWAALLGAFLGFHYWTDTLAVSSTYRWAMAIPFTPPDWKWNLLLVLGTCGIAFGVAWRSRDSQAHSLAGRPVFLLAAMIFSLAYLQSAIIRSDSVHLAIGWSVAVALAGLSLLGRETFRSRHLLFMQLVIASVLLALYLNPGVFFVPVTLASALTPNHYKASECPESLRYLDGVCIPDSALARLHGVVSYLQTHSTASDSVAVFPFHNIYGNLARRLVAGAVLQNYVAAGDWLVRRQLQGFEKQKPVLAVYSTDAQYTTISGFPNLTRSPEIWLYLQARYHTVTEIPPDVFVLRRDDARRQQWTAQYSPLEVNPAARNMVIDRAGSLAMANRISWPATADLIRIRLLLSYPQWWIFGKPWSVSVLVGRADGTTKSVPVLVPPNRETDVWVYPGDDALLASYFSADPTAWQAGALAPVTSLTLTVSSMGWGSARPLSASVRRVDAVSLGMSGPPAKIGRAGAN